MLRCSLRARSASLVCSSALRAVVVQSGQHGHPCLACTSQLTRLPLVTSAIAVGAIIGMTLIAVGPSAVLWSSNSDTFPYIGGVASL